MPGAPLRLDFVYAFVPANILLLPFHVCILFNILYSRSRSLIPPLAPAALSRVIKLIRCGTAVVRPIRARREQ